MSTLAAVTLALGIIAGVVVLLFIAIAGNVLVRITVARDRATAAVTSCSGSENFGHVEYDLNNPSGRSRTYVVHAAVYNASGTRIGTGVDVASDVPAHSTVHGKVIVPVAGDGARCEITSVD